jgi:hypothetical protein
VNARALLAAACVVFCSGWTAAYADQTLLDFTPDERAQILSHGPWPPLVAPDAAYARDALAKVDQVVYMSTSLNTGHAWGTGAEETIILPVLARDEEPEPTTQESMFSYIRLSDGGQRRHVGPRSEVEIIADLAIRVLGDRVSGSGGQVLVKGVNARGKSQGLGPGRE